MQCPYCGNEMQPGIFSFGGKSYADWKPNEDSGNIKKIVVKPYDLMSDELEADFCHTCKKMVLDLRDLKEQEALFVFMKDHDNILTR